MSLTAPQARAFFEAALEAERGKRLPCKSLREARAARLALYRVRQKDRDMMQAAGGAATSPYDDLALVIKSEGEGENERWFVVVERSDPDAILPFLEDC